LVAPKATGGDQGPARIYSVEIGPNLEKAIEVVASAIGTIALGVAFFWALSKEK
jgi:hypothetical protein